MQQPQSTPVASVALDAELLANRVLEALDGLRFGAVEITVHEGKVVQIERREKFRFQPPAAGKS